MKYLLLRANDFVIERDGRFEIDRSISVARVPLSNSEPPDGFKLVQTILMEGNGKAEVYAKAFALRPTD